MKSKIKRHSRSALAVILTLSMLVSCMMVGLIATDAARVTDSGTVGAQENSEDVGAMIDDTDSAVGAQENSDSVGDGETIASGSTLIVNSGCYGNTTLYAYFYGGTVSDNWVSLTRITSGNFEGKYYCTVPSGSPTNVIICRMSESNGSWDNRLNQTDNASLTGNYIIVSSTWGNSDSYVDGKGYKKETVSVSAKEFKVFVRNGSLDNHTVETRYDLTNDNGSGVFSITTPAIVAAYTHFEVKNYNYNNGGTDVWYGEGGNYWLNDTVVGNSYIVTASVDIKNVSTSDWTGSTFSKTLVSSDSHYSLTGDIWSSCITQINGSANGITRGAEDDGEWWGSYHSDAAIGTPTGTAGEYYIDITTADRATLVASNPTFKTVDIGLYLKDTAQKAFKIGDTYYNEIGKDYKVTSSGVSNADIVDLAASKGGGSLQLQPGRSYRITVNETTRKISVAENPHVDKYFLAGEYSDGSVQFFGEKWNTSNNELVYNNSTQKYELEFTENIPAGTIKFKTVKNGDSDGWDGGSWPTGNNNQTYAINANATKVKFSFDATNNTMTVTQENSGGGGTATGWLYSGTAAASRTTVTPTSGMTTFDATKHASSEYGDFRFMYNKNDPGLDNVIVPSYYKTGNDSNSYWAELTPKMEENENFFVGLANSWNKGNMVGNNSEEVNDSSSDKEIKDTNDATLFRLSVRENSGVSGSAKYILINNVDWNKVSAIGVKAYDNSKSTNGNNSHSGKVDYKIYYKAKVVAPVVEATLVDIYAKNGTLRDSTYNRFTNLADTDILEDYFYYAETDASTGDVTEYNSISTYNSAHSSKQIVVTHENAYGDSNYDKMTNVPVGAKIKLRTTLDSSSSTAGSFDGKAFKDTHYLKAYSFNGMTYEVHSYDSSGVYEEVWTVRAVNTTYMDGNGDLQNATKDGKSVEVTPIYYMKDNTNCKTFYIDGYDGEVQSAWGNLLCVYPYYEGIKEKGNAFGGYPGQPMLFWGGKYQMEIPLTVDGTANGASVRGLTMHNSFWDLFHRSLDIRCNARNHAQTYDYDDFYKLYKEKNPDTIIFDYKYRKTHDNYGEGYQPKNYTFADNTTRAASKYAGSGYNGVEIVTDYFGRQVDAFGNLITDANQSNYGEDDGSGGTVAQSGELLFVSDGYKNTYVGEYATIWAVYAPTTANVGGSGDTANKFIGYISSSMLYLNNIDRRLQYTGGDSTDSGRMSWQPFIDTYNHLKSYYVGVPALISYERELWNDDDDSANRSDGKWYYSNKNDKVSASIKIQYGSHTLMDAPDHSVSSDAWHDDPFDNSQTGVGGENNIGTNTGCSAYFTNTTPNLLGKVASGEQFADSTKSFTFQAVPSGSYMFAGWVRYSNGKYYEISEKEVAESPMSANDVYIARFVDAQVGSLTIQHVVEKTDEFNGTGTPRLQVTVKNGGTTVTGGSFDVSDSSKVDISKWIDSHFASYTIDISLTTTPTGESFMKEIESSSGNYATLKSTWNAGVTSTTGTPSETGAQSTTVAQFTVQSILDSGVTSLRYVSHLMSPKYTYNYEITYTYYSRFWGQQSYTQTGTCEEGDFTGAKDTATLTTDFIINKTPYEKNFREQINWNYTTSTVEAGDYDAAPMENNAAGTAASANTYKMTAHVYASKEVNDRVTAEFILPYYYNDKSQGYTVHNADVYANAEKPHGDYESDHTYLYDTSHESVTLDTQAYKLFTYDGGDVAGGNDVLASQTHLMEAAPYLMMDGGTGHEIAYHYQLVDKSRTYTGNSFTANGITYYLNSKPDGSAAGNNEVIINSENASQYQVTFTKIKYIGASPAHPTTYNYAVAEGTEGTYGYKIYFFSYRMNENEQMVDNEGNLTDTPVFNGQVVVYSVDHEIDGIIKNTGVKKYFTRWDIRNTKGEYVASCYNRRFNYSGYDNYVVRPIYESDEEQHYESSLGTGTMASITHLGDTRNQWNNSAKGEYASVTHLTDGNTAGDKLIHDFALAYAYNGQEIQTIPNSTTDSTNGHDIKIGMVIEKLDPLDSSGSTKIFDSTYYADKYKSTVNATLLSNLKSAAEGEMKFYAATGNHSCKNLKIGANVDEWGTKFGTSTTTALSFNSVIDNFNRLQWFYTFDNTKTGEGGTIGANNNANFAYRAWAYIIVDGTATVCNTPTYFTLYDSARR